MSPKPKVSNWQPILDHLTGSLAAIRALQSQLSSVARPAVPMPAVHDVLLQYSLGRLPDFPRTTLRPLAKDATWTDKPSGKSFHMADYDKAMAALWQAAFPDFREDVVNLIGNEDYLVVERKSSGTHKGPLRLPGITIPPSGAPLVLNSACVVEFKAGQMGQIENYYDLGAVLRALKLIPDMPMGHDETTAMPAILHASGFQGVRHTMPAAGQWPVKIGNPISSGHGSSAEAKANIDKCKAIHQAFVKHRPDDFAQLIAQDSVWIDVPTGQVLNGAVAAATHDHGNWMTAFPDSSAEVLNLISNEDWCVVQHRGFGKNTGPLTLGGKVYPPTGKNMEMQVLDINQYKNGKAVLIRNYYDMATMIMQLGIMPG